MMVSLTVEYCEVCVEMQMTVNITLHMSIYDEHTTMQSVTASAEYSYAHTLQCFIQFDVQYDCLTLFL